jgi:hypothetical protein
MYSLSVDRLDGMNLEGICFRRERFYPDWYTANTGQRPLEHSSYAASEPMREVMETRGYRTELNEDSHFGFTFAREGVPAFLRVDTAEEITVAFSPGYIRRFEYDPETGLYTAYNRFGPQVDAEDGEAVRVRNIIIQLVKTHVIPGDAEGRRVVQTVGEGGGFLISDGYYHRISWKKDSHTEPVRWYFLNGNEMELGIGRTWVNVFQENGKIDFGDEEDE